jgi:acetyl-CoA carboxylase biotin carboxyl carrier protein
MKEVIQPELGGGFETGPDRPVGRNPEDVERTLVAAQRSAAYLLATTSPPPSVVRVWAADVRIELVWHDTPHDRTAPAEPQPVRDTPPVGQERNLKYVTSSMVGVFYRAPQPGTAPFVKEGDDVVTGQQVGIIEAMKLMVPVESDRSGRIVEVLKADGEPVEYGDWLFAVEPADLP